MKNIKNYKDFERINETSLDAMPDTDNVERTSKPQITLNMRMSTDESHNQRYTTEEVNEAFVNDNIRIERKLVVRKTDGAVMGEILV